MDRFWIDNMLNDMEVELDLYLQYLLSDLPLNTSITELIY